jgi:hypothetical protein
MSGIGDWWLGIGVNGDSVIGRSIGNSISRDPLTDGRVIAASRIDEDCADAEDRVMRRWSMNRILILPVAFVIALPLSALGFKEGPYPNVTGGFGEQSCHLCHLDNPINAPGGSVALDGVPERYESGKSYRLTVTISREGLRRGGFEIAARFATGRLRGKQAGAWKPIDDRVQLIPGAVDKVLTFVQHNLAGSRVPATGANRWTIEWTAPSPASAPVQFNVAANASNNDDSPLGDYIYLKSVKSAPGSAKALAERTPR